MSLSCLARLLVAGGTLVLAACAATRYEAPPEVAPQPPEVTAAEVVAEQAEVVAEQQAAEDDIEAAAHGVEPAPVPPAAPTRPTPPVAGPAAVRSAQPAAVPTSTSTSASAAARAQRYRPTELSVVEVRTRNARTPMPLDFTQRLDDAHDRVYAWTQSMVEATDRRFIEPDQPARPVPAAPFRVGLVGEYLQHGDGPRLGMDGQFDISLRLPNLERRMKIFISSGNLDEAPRDDRDSDGVRAGLRYQPVRSFDFDIGIKVDVPPVAFASLKWSREFAVGAWDFYPFAKLFAETKESVGWAGALTFDRWSGRHVLRTSTYAKWRADRERMQWSETLIYARAHELIVPDRIGSYPRANDIGRGWGVRALAGGDTARTVDHYETGMFYRRPTPNRWLYWSVEPLVRWDRRFNWSADPGVRIGVEALFWDLARTGR